MRRFEYVARLCHHRCRRRYRLLQVTAASIAISPTVGPRGGSTVAMSAAVLMLHVAGECDTEPKPQVQQWRYLQAAGAVIEAFPAAGYQRVGGAYDRFGPPMLAPLYCRGCAGTVSPLLGADV